MTLIKHLGGPFVGELKTFYSKQLLARLVPAIRRGYPIAVLGAQRRMKFGFPYTLDYGRARWSLPQSIHRWMTGRGTYSRLSHKWVVICGPCDSTPRLPQDKTPRLPVDKLVPTTFIQATEPKNAKGGDIWIRS